MKSKKPVIFGVLALFTLLLVSQTLFTVHETQQAIVLQFGDPRAVKDKPGLHWKVPFVQNVTYYEKRTLDLDPPPFEVLLTDKKRINVDAFARYRIVNALEFFKTVQNEVGARDRLAALVNPALRAVIARVSLKEVLSAKRTDLMEQIQKDIEADALRFGIKIVDIRIGRTDLPEQTSQAVFNRMRTERERQAREARAEGKEIAQKIRAQADKERTVILANAERDAQIQRGQGEAGRNNILGQAYGRDPKFFAFYKSLEQYQKALIGNDTTMVLSPDSEFFRFFNNFNLGKKRN
ncbi:MAG: protease modulator HflC [Rhodospirillaceae bacterium]|nr:protease modulator HflC [Rhodospirillaceae bacterium]|tara:strand:- start:95 stop:976 length:882 start_codon:yes stop_codon:yes gene_type:complete